ncbi:hypothetical protein AWM70_08370 [Paenibacillus yonginensis]|uniref:Prenylated flavin chaperone LpdD-like domain-containing protein n=1 Tax=Paenibacillus yonginensis TaxID=1462996 RepID=A0A1B1MZK6_9BACL|nr:hypothetical protein [Paenibacillus yonginensis]ANS74596.1 hypothetical protein AWM70_08370 [Paenibacillus yonginensis]
MGTFDDLELKAIRLGLDHLIVITGGAAHVGAASTSFPAANGAIETYTAAVPGHKEHLLTDGLADQISRQLGVTAVVVMGIHYDGLKPEEIEEISRRTERMVDSYIAEIKSANG